MSFLLFIQVYILFLSCVASYTPEDYFAVNCGSFGNYISVDGRNWTGDIGSERFSPIDNNNSIVVSIPYDQRIPYNTTRLSRSEFFYLFPMNTDGQKFIRLYFYPNSYNRNFFLTDSLFSVRAGTYTLLKDFNASIAADDEEIIVREYCINVFEPDMDLIITFTPSLSHPNSLAFINGIEVISMPSYLYYTKPDDQQAMLQDGGTIQFPVKNKSALETMYRLNVGGRQIPPIDDTGMFRNWEPDYQYVEIERPRSISVFFGNQSLTYKDGQNYFAPDAVYKTARNYGMKETSRFNVTWEFQVDTEFTYMVRLHFCEFDEQIQNVGDRVFQIFIDDVLVEPIADVMIWSGKQILVPVRRDYAVSMQSKGSLKKLNLTIKLQPHPYARSTYRDILLNGIEILKISDFKYNLGGANPDRLPSPPLPPKASKNPLKKKVISIVVGSASSFIILSLIVLFIFCRLLARGVINEGKSQGGYELASTSKRNKSSLLLSDLSRCFSFDEIRSATNNFDDNLIIGVGGFGNVYKGHIDNGSVSVAIKRLKQGSQQGLKEFQTEIELLSQLRHHHLVSLIGYCNDDNEMILVYEFMARGTFREHLYDSNNQPLSWIQRVEICLGAARGLHYLHTGAKHAIIHRDVKSTNILIDENWMAKISDFGLSKIGPSGISRSNINISTLVKGSIGYLDPEYYTLQVLTDKSDVYSFGVLLLEALCGRPPILRAVEKERQNLVEWFRRCVDENQVYDTVDPFLRGSMTAECLKVYTKIALKCVDKNGNERPSMGDVMLGLESLMELLSKEDKKNFGGTLNEDIIVEEGSGSSG